MALGPHCSQARKGVLKSLGILWEYWLQGLLLCPDPMGRCLCCSLTVQGTKSGH